MTVGEKRIVDHAGQPIAPGSLGVAPPAEIGELLSVDPDTHDRQLGVRIILLAMTIVGGVGCIALGTHALLFSQPRDRGLELGTLAVCIALEALIVCATAIASRPKRQITFVGRLGVAMLTLNRSGTGIAQSRVVPFAHCDDLFVRHTRQLIGGTYVLTLYSFRWTGASSFDVKGMFRSAAHRPHEHHPYYFALAAERAWSEHVLRRVQPEFARTKLIAFPVSGRDMIHIGPGVIHFQFGGGHEQLAREQIAEATVRNGTFFVRSRDARWFGLAGKFQFRYGQIANARVFLIALNRLLGLNLIDR